ncbi:MAG: cyclase family protein [Acidobacteria bacterium]|nr:cyclase family protein [Acidobacteriota bacterium]
MRMKALLFFRLSVILFLLTAAPCLASDWLEAILSGEAKIIDLTHTLHPKIPYVPSPAYTPFKLEQMSSLDTGSSYSNRIVTPEHMGTHVDAPNHYVAGKASVDQIPVERFFAPAVVLDISAKVKDNADYLLTVEDIKAWEATHGSIPEGAVVFIYTGFSRYWDDPGKYLNQDANGTRHTPGFAKEAAEFLVKERKINGVGTDALSLDGGSVSARRENPRTHHIILGAGLYGIENVANLDRLSPTGAFVMIAPMKIQGGSGGPARVFAILK